MYNFVILKMSIRLANSFKKSDNHSITHYIYIFVDVDIIKWKRLCYLYKRPNRIIHPPCCISYFNIIITRTRFISFRRKLHEMPDKIGFGRACTVHNR